MNLLRLSILTLLANPPFFGCFREFIDVFVWMLLPQVCPKIVFAWPILVRITALLPEASVVANPISYNPVPSPTNRMTVFL
jgi:hypothetical protein